MIVGRCFILKDGLFLRYQDKMLEDGLFFSLLLIFVTTKYFGQLPLVYIHLKEYNSITTVDYLCEVLGLYRTQPCDSF